MQLNTNIREDQKFGKPRFVSRNATLKSNATRIYRSQTRCADVFRMQGQSWSQKYKSKKNLRYTPGSFFYK